jgi:hypothetical protein
MSEEIVASQLNLRKYKVSKSQLRMIKVNPIQPVPSPNTIISTTGGNEYKHQIQNAPFNPSRCIAHMTVSPIAPGASMFNHLFLNALTPLNQIRLVSLRGVEAMNLIYVQNYTNVLWYSEIPDVEFENYDTFYDGVGSGRFLRKSNDIVTSVNKGSFAIRAPAGNATTLTPASLNYKESSYFEIGAVNTVSPVLDISFPLSMLKGTVLAMDKTICFNEIMELIFTFGPASKIGFHVDNATGNLNGTPVSIASAQVDNLYCWIAFEQDEEVKQKIRTQIAKGMEILIPYVIANKTLTSASSNQNVRFQLGRANGRELLKVYTAFYPSAETLKDTYYHAMTPTILDNFYTTIDGHRLQDSNIKISSYDDWAIMQKKLEGGLCFNSNIYRYNWFWVDQFDGQKLIGDDLAVDQSNLKVGKDLSGGLLYEFVGTGGSNTAYNVYQFAQVSRLMKITNEGFISCD